MFYNSEAKVLKISYMHKWKANNKINIIYFLFHLSQ